MYNNNDKDQEEIFSKVLRAGRRTYFFDVRETKASDYYLTITESKKFTNDDGTFHYKKHKIYLYKEDFNDFSLILSEMVNFIIKERGEEGDFLIKVNLAPDKFLDFLERLFEPSGKLPLNRS